MTKRIGQDMSVVHVDASRSYDIYIGEGLLERAGELTSGLKLGKKILIVSDDTVAALYLDRLRGVLTACGYECTSYVFEHGEASKSQQTLFGILGHLAKSHFDRSDSIFALGGGVVGDVAGFAASVYMRGIRFVGIPTTLLSATDSSVGGKTAIDIPQGKNLVGSFWQPSAVICDVRLLDTLSPEYFSDGMAEVIKYAMIRDASLMTLIEGGRASERIIDVIRRCVEIKRDVVSQDEHDRGVRAILNFGHTAAHAIEAHSGYEISHGRAVGMGMVMITRACERLGLCECGTLEKLCRVMSDYDLTVECPYPAEELLSYIENDKKCDGGGISLVLSRGVGSCEVKWLPLSEAGKMFE